MKKLKCWKKTTKTGTVPSWTHKTERYSIWVAPSGGRGTGYDLLNEIEAPKHSKTKSGAISFAQKYMKEHNSC